MMAATASCSYKSFVCQPPKLLKCYLNTRIFTLGPRHLSRIPKLSKFRKVCLTTFAAGVATCGALIYALENSVVQASGLEIVPPRYPWTWKGMLSSFDHGNIRRGWQVYKQVCSQCHTLQFVCYRHLVGVCLTEDEAKEIAAESEFRDGPDDEGNYFMRPGKLTDHIVKPFENEQAARAANNGSLPVDLSEQANYHTNRIHKGSDYIFSLLTGYTEPPAGVEVPEGKSFNPYFPGGTISMAEVLQPGLVEYEDGTPATVSQMAKDITEFLMWTCNMEHDTRKSYVLKVIGICTLLTGTVFTMHRKISQCYKSTYVCYASLGKAPKSKCSLIQSERSKIQ